MRRGVGNKRGLHYVRGEFEKQQPFTSSGWGKMTRDKNGMKKV